MKKTSKNAKHVYRDCNFEVGLTGFDEERRLNAHSFTTSPAAMVTAEAAIKEAERKVRDAIMREAIARNASASAAKAQVSAEAEVFVLRADASRLRDELRSAEDALQRASSERHASEATARSVAAENDTLRAEYANARREIDELNAVLRARSQDITQLGGVIISVYRGEVDPRDLRDMADGIAHVIGPQKPTPAVRDHGDGGDSSNPRASRERPTFLRDERIRRSDEDERRAKTSFSSSVSSAHATATRGRGDVREVTHAHEQEEEAEDASVPINSAFFGVDAEEISWDEPLSVRETRRRPLGVPTLALEKLAPPPDDPDAAMLEFAYEQQYGPEAAKRMVEEAKAAR
jgi:hypothetical protein